MPLVIFAGAEIVLALIAVRIAWWILRSGGWRLESTLPPQAPDPSPPRDARPRRAGFSAPPVRRRAIGERHADSEAPRELAS